MEVAEFKHKMVRDLAWVIGSPSLLLPQPDLPVISDDWCQKTLDQHWDWLWALDEQPDVLATEIHAKNTVYLGKYFEALIEFWLDRSPRFELLLSQYPVHENKRTVGEIDFIFRTEEGQVFHWETAVKFYLAYGAPEDLNEFKGPEGRDGLLGKLEKVRYRQLTLTDGSKSRLLPESIRDLRPEPRLFIKGIFFYHWKYYFGSNSTKWAAIVNSKHLHGWWISRNETSLLPPDGSWIVLDKKDWIGHLKVEDHNIHTTDSIIALLSQRKEALAVGQIGRKNNGDFEVSDRGFIVNR